MTVTEIVQKEHFYIASLKITIGNSIKSLKEIGRINFGELFSQISGAEEILKLDPAGVYSNMEEKSKNYYRGIIENLAKKYRVSEIYIAEKIIELCSRYEQSEDLIDKKKSHIGYYLVDDGIYDLKEELEGKKIVKIKKEKKARLYVSGVILLSLYIDFVFTMKIYVNLRSILITILFALISIVPISENSKLYFKQSTKA